MRLILVNTQTTFCANDTKLRLRYSNVGEVDIMFEAFHILFTKV